MSITATISPLTHVSDKARMVRERRYSPTVPLMELLNYIRRIKGTGTLMIDLNQGGIGSVRYCEETSIEFDEKLS
jgi:hypothetical protein